MAEWEYSADIAFGQKSARVKLVQEWLTFHGHATNMDKDYGSATKACVEAFQAKRHLPVDGRLVDRATFEALAAPMTRAIAPMTGGASLADLTLRYARQHLREKPREIGGDNAGPWVRLYMKGREGRPWQWCAGFVTTILAAAAETAGTASPYPFEMWVPSLAQQGKATGAYFKASTATGAALVRPGYFFLVPDGANFWSHVGIVESVQGETFQTIEGNSGAASNAVVSQTRRLKNYDFLRI